MKRYLFLLATGISTAPISVALAQQQPAAAQPTAAKLTAAEAARRFGAVQAVRQISLSPDGTRYAMIRATKGRAMALVVGPVDASGPAKSIVVADGNPEQLARCDWANDTRLICQAVTTTGSGQDLIGFSRTIAVNADGTGMKMVSVQPGSRSLGIVQYGGNIIDWLGDPEGKSILMTSEVVPENSTGTHLAKQQEGLGVDRVDPVSFKRTSVETANIQAEDYITDGIGNVRIMALRAATTSGYAGSNIRFSYRQPNSRKWELLSVVQDNSQSLAGFVPLAVDPATNVAFGFDQQDGRSALFKVALDGTGKRDLVFARPDVDVDGLVRIGRKRRVVGVSYSTERRQTYFFDPELAKLRQGLAKALPELPLITFVDSSLDESRLLLRAGSDNDPGQYMIYDKKTHHLDPVMDVRPEVSGMKLAVVKPVTYAAADGTQVPGYLTLPPGSDGKNIPAIVMPHGGPSDRDEWGFDWLAQFFAARGYAVLQPNYRGSAGYGEGWYQQNGFKSWRTAIGDINDGGRWLVKQGITTLDKLAIVGWSYGGYAALQSPVLDPDLFKAIVAVAPVTDLTALREEHADLTDYLLVDKFIGSGPHIKEGSPAQNVAAIKAPVLMFHGDRDQNVGIGESRLMLARMKAAGKPVELIEYPGLAHSLSDSDVRAQMLEKIDNFLRASMKVPQ